MPNNEQSVCDRRITRSKKALRGALIALMEQRGCDGFTVNELCTQADLNRGTFYNHYLGIQDFLESLEQDFLTGLEGYQSQMGGLTLASLAIYQAKQEPVPLLVGLFEYLRGYGDLLHALLGPGGDVRFGVRLREELCGNLIHSILHEHYRNDTQPIVGYYVAYFTAAYLGVIERWVETGMREDPEEMALIAIRLLFIKPGEPIRL